MFALIERFNAWRRGEKRIAPSGLRGRVYAKEGTPGVQAKARMKPSMTMRVWRAAEGAWYRQDPGSKIWLKE